MRLSSLLVFFRFEPLEGLVLASMVLIVVGGGVVERRGRMGLLLSEDEE